MWDNDYKDETVLDRTPQPNMSENKLDITTKELATLFRMLLIGEHVLTMTEEYKDSKSEKYESLMDKVYTFLKNLPQTSNLVSSFHGKLLPKDKIAKSAEDAAFDYDELTFYEMLSIKLGQRDFIEQATPAEKTDFKKKGYFPAEVSRHIDAYKRELADHDVTYIRAIPPDLHQKLYELAKNRKACFICGKTEKLVKTECCNHWICDDEEKYELFSFSDASCHRNHRRFTLCGIHYEEGHKGNWQHCEKCRKMFDDEMYAYYGTNEYNHTILPNPPTYEPTHCAKCRMIISRGYDPYTSMPDGTFLCVKCDPNHLQHAAP